MYIVQANYSVTEIVRGTAGFKSQVCQSLDFETADNGESLKENNSFICLTAVCATL